jgi:hypothetical protein
MAKSKRKPSPKQLDPKLKELAKQAKASGFLSPRTNLRKKALSRYTVKKLEGIEWALKNNYKAVKVKPQELMAAKLQGLHTVGRSIIVPKDNRSEKRLRQGIVTGVRSIPGANMQVVVLPYPSMTEFLKALRTGAVDKLKEPDEDFAFTIYGHKSTKAFRNANELLHWLIKYDAIVNPLTGALLKDMNEAYANFTLWKMLHGKYNPPEYDERRAMRNERRHNFDLRREANLNKRKARNIADLSADARFKRREANALAAKKYRENMTDEQRAKRNAQAAARVKAARERKKGEKK